MKSKVQCLEGELVCFPSGGRRLDGFLRRGAKQNRRLLVFVHGMGSNFYRSRLKKEFLRQAPACGLGVLSFNNRGHERGTEDERFPDCLRDLDAALAFGRQQGYREFVLVGHSTGCQKIIYYQAKRQRTDVAALVLLSPSDDYALNRRDLGKKFAATVARARSMLRQGRERELISGLYERFTARRFLSVADPRQVEASIFNYAGDFKIFRRVRTPLLAVFGSREEFALLPPATMLEMLGEATRSPHYASLLVPHADHSFHRHEEATAVNVLAWLQTIG